MLLFVTVYIKRESIMLAKLENMIVINFSGIVFAFALFWLSLIAYGLLSQ